MPSFLSRVERFNSPLSLIAGTLALSFALWTAWEHRPVDSFVVAQCFTDRDAGARPLGAAGHSEVFEAVFPIFVLFPDGAVRRGEYTIPGGPWATHDEAVSVAKAWGDKSPPSQPCWADPHNPDGIAFGRPSTYRDSAVGVGFAAALFVLFALDRRAARILRDLDRREADRLKVLTLERFHALRRALSSLPATSPPGWSEPFLQGTSGHWWIRAGDIIFLVTSRPFHDGHALEVMLVGRKGEAVPDDQAHEILSRFVGVGEFVEKELPVGKGPPNDERRMWAALSPEASASMPEPETLPRPVGEPLNSRLQAAKEHFPVNLPRGWSVPVAMTRPRDGWSHGGWMFEVDDLIVMTTVLVTDEDPQLYVAMFRQSLEEVSELASLEILKRFRHIKAFKQDEADEFTVLGGIAFVGDIEEDMGARRKAVLYN
jgi:hypothetical protein